jgi:branched-chain amino acid transport system ATP-binding protein
MFTWGKRGVIQMLKIDSVSFSYGDVQVLHNVNLEIEKDTITTLLGTNGAGKTTLMRIISGLFKPSAGSITFNGTDITSLAPHQICSLGLLHVPEGRKLFPRMTVKENLELGALRTSREERVKLLRHVYEIFPLLEKRQNQKAETLSGGEQQQVAIGRSLMGRPKLLLLDEPTLGLSPVLTTAVLETVSRLNREDGLTILLVSQEVVGALDIAGFGYVLENGRVVIQGTSSELKDNNDVQCSYLGL